MNTTAGDSGAPTQGEKEARWPERCPLCSHAFGRDAVVFDLATHVAVRHADEMKAWLAALSALQEEAGADEWPIVIEAVADARADYDEDSEGWAALDAFVAHYRRLTEGDYRTDSEHGRWLAPQVAPTDAPPNAIRPARVWADGTVREWWVDDGDGPKIVVVHQELAPPVAQPEPDGWITRGDVARIRSPKDESVPSVHVWKSQDPGDHPIYIGAPPVAGPLRSENAAGTEMRDDLPPVAGSRETHEQGCALRCFTYEVGSGETIPVCTCARLRAPAPGTGEAEGLVLPKALCDALEALEDASEGVGEARACEDPPEIITGHLAQQSYARDRVVEAINALRAPGTGGEETPQEHWLNAIAEYTVHAPNCPYYEDGSCECAVEEFRATLRRVLVPSRLRAASNEQGKDVVVIGLERILKAVDVPDTLLSGTRSVLRRAIARLRAGTGDTPRFKRTIVCAACAMEDDDPLVCDTPGCDGQPRFVTAEWFDGRAPGTGTEEIINGALVHLDDLRRLLPAREWADEAHSLVDTLTAEIESLRATMTGTEEAP